MDWSNRLTFTVTELNEYVKKTLEAEPLLRSICLRGEVNGVKKYPSGTYFTLKDEGAAVSAVIWRSNAMRLKTPIRDGMRVTAQGYVTLYVERGQYQFTCVDLQPEGQGDLYARFLELKAKLQAEGLFDASRKKPLPLLSRRIGILTSENGAVIHDIERVSRRRNPAVELVLCPVPVQGEGAAPVIAKAIRRMDALGFDVLIVGRGGGSLEDLWPFNEECVARAVCACKTPVISAVGHEVDFTICDMAADLRAATPSEAAELAVCDTEELADTIQSLAERMRRAVGNCLTQKELRLDRLTSALEKLGPAAKAEAQQRRLLELRMRMRDAMTARLHRAESDTQYLAAALAKQHPAGKLALLTAQTEHLSQRLIAAEEKLLRAGEARVDQLSSHLEALSPESVLSRGYALVTTGGHAASDANALSPGDLLDIRMRDGSVSALTISVFERSAEHGQDQGTDL